MIKSNSGNINNVFFDGVYKDVWKKLIPPGLSEAESDFIFDVAELNKGDRLLDLMCGYGRHAVDLSGRGIEVTAIDNSTEYINEIEVAAIDQHLAITAIAYDTLSVPLKGPYKAAICMGNSFAFFNKRDCIQLLQKISQNLEEGGSVIINSWMIAEIAIRNFKAHDWQQVGEYKYLLDYNYEFFPSRIESEHTIVSPTGVYEVIKGVDYIYTLNEMEEMFQQAGLTTKALYSTPRKKTFTLGNSSIYIHAVKTR